MLLLATPYAIGLTLNAFVEFVPEPGNMYITGLMPCDQWHAAACVGGRTTQTWRAPVKMDQGLGNRVVKENSKHRFVMNMCGTWQTE